MQLNDPGAQSTFRKALGQARAAGDASAEANAALGLGQLLAAQGARVEGGQMLQEAAAAARRMGPRGTYLARRADDLLISMGPIEASPRRTAELPRRVEIARPAETAPEEEVTPPPPDNQEGGGDAVFRETTLPPL